MIIILLAEPCKATHTEKLYEKINFSAKVFPSSEAYPALRVKTFVLISPQKMYLFN